MNDLETAPQAVPEPASPKAAAPSPATKTTLDINEIMAILPHRYPFLLIDRVLEMEPRQRIVAIKNVTINEPHFTGHFPDYPIMPGVLMVEAIAQTGGALLLTEIPDRDQKLMVFTGIESARFRRPVTPGDQLRIEVKVVNWRSRAVKMAGVITVDGKVVCDATVTCQVVPRMRTPAAAPPVEAAASTVETSTVETSPVETAE
jgi:3-hydroxyacyl-[acyl-carrier-protein] dehydratase